MMQVRMYALFDIKAKQFEVPFCSQTDELACRELKTMMNRQPNGLLCQFAEDFELWHIGMYHTEAGEVSSINKLHVCKVKELIPNVLKDKETPSIQRKMEQKGKVERSKSG